MSNSCRNREAGPQLPGAVLNRQLATLRTELQLLQLLQQPDQWVELAPQAKPATATKPARVTPRPRPDVVAGLTGPQSDLFHANQQIQLLKAKRDELAKSAAADAPENYQVE